MKLVLVLLSVQTFFPIFFAEQSCLLALDNQIINIYDIQGESHISPYLNQEVKTKGIVTGVKKKGFYLQDSIGDNNDLTSDGIFVFTKTQTEVKIGDKVTIKGKIAEDSTRENNLSITTLYPNSISVLSSNNPLPPGIIIGEKGRKPPTTIIDDDFLMIFNPQLDGIDFYETLEGMRVTVKNTVAVSPINRFGEVFILADKGINATGISPRNTITITKADLNPERLQIQRDNDLSPDYPESIQVGDHLGDVTGIMSYNFGNYEVLVTDSFSVTRSNLKPEVTALIPTENQLTIASYNVLNLDPNDDDGDKDIEEGRFKAIASQIVNNLKNPDIIALQEIQDNSGSEDDGTTKAHLTYQTLISEIKQISGVNYKFIDIPPQNNQDGGQPGGNIRVGYLFNPQRVQLINNSIKKIDDLAFNNTRKSLVVKFKFKNQEFTLINNHFMAKGGSTPLFGKVQPPVNGGEDKRKNQAQVINNYVNDLLAINRQEKVIVLGDFNEFEFMEPLLLLEGDTLTNLTNTLPTNERYTYIYQGNSQTLDHILVTKNLTKRVKYEQVHLNSEFVEGNSDHDPVIVSIKVE